MAEVDITDADYETWIQPAVAIARLLPVLGHENHVRKELWNRLRNGRLRSAYHSSQWRRGIDSVSDRGLEELTARVWLISKQPEDWAMLWKTGSHGFSVKEGASNGPVLEIDCFGIRFDPSGIQDIFVGAGADMSNALAPSKPTRRQDLPVLPETIAKAWIDWFKTQPNASKDAAEKAAAHMFVNHNLSRERIREFWGESQLGRPRKTAS